MSHFRHLALLLLIFNLSGCMLVDPERFGRFDMPTEMSDQERKEKTEFIEWGEANFPAFLHKTQSKENAEKFRTFMLFMANLMGYEWFDTSKVVVLSHAEGLKKRHMDGCFIAETGFLKLNPVTNVTIKTFIHELGHLFYEGLLYTKFNLGSETVDNVYFGLSSKQVFDKKGWMKHYELIAERNIFRYLQGRARLTKKRGLRHLELYPVEGGYLLCRAVGQYAQGMSKLSDHPAVSYLLSATDHETLWQVIRAYNVWGEAHSKMNMANFEEVILTSHYEDQDKLNKDIADWTPSQIRKAVNIALKEQTVLEHFKRFIQKREDFFSQFDNH